MLRVRLLSALLIASSLLLGLTVIPPPASAAATVTVTDCTRAGLAAAISTASPGGTVTFDCDPATITIDNHLEITQNVTIDGSNAGHDTQITLDGESDSHFFVVTAGKLTLKHLTLTNSESDHGALHIQVNAAAEVTNVAFTSNKAWFDGGAIYNSGTLTITLSTFTSNSANTSGAIYNSGTLTISHSTFTDNSSAFLGGAIRSTGSATISQSNFTHNRAGTDGGAIDSEGSLIVERSTFVNNQATFRGGAITLWRGSLTLTASTLTGNTAPDGSAVDISQYSQGATITWSTIIQPQNSTPALHLAQDLTLVGVILGGEDQHCHLAGGSLTNAYTFSNDTSCNLDGLGSRQGLTNLGLAAVTTITNNGVQHFYYPLLETSPAIDAGPTTCDTDAIAGPDPDQIGNPRPFHYYCDIGAIESPFATSLLCANQWNGALRMTNAPRCDRSETLIKLGQHAPITLCVNPWNGATRLGSSCSRTEQTITATGDGTLSTCINTWTSTLRISQTCTRAETHHWL